MSLVLWLNCVNSKKLKQPCDKYRLYSSVICYVIIKKENKTEK